MHEEYLDVLNEKGEKTGVAKSYADVHKEGLPHRSAHVWIFNSEKKLLIQKRASTRQSYPEHWDMSVEGHVSVGQTSLEAAIRETKEELGIDISDSSFKYLFSTEEHVVLNNGSYINNEFQDVYLVQLDTPTPDIKFTDGEVSEIKWVSVEEFKDLLDNQKLNFVPHYSEYKKIFDFLN